MYATLVILALNGCPSQAPCPPQCMLPEKAVMVSHHINPKKMIRGCQCSRDCSCGCNSGEECDCGVSNYTKSSYPIMIPTTVPIYTIPTYQGGYGGYSGYTSSINSFRGSVSSNCGSGG